MNLEMDALNKNNTWELVYLTNGKIHVGCIWVYNVKIRLMDLLIGTRLDWLRKDSPKLME